MKLSNAHQTAIEHIVLTYLARVNALPKKEVVFSFVIKPDNTSILSSHLLYQPFEALWLEYKGSIPDHIHTRILHMANYRKIVYMYDLVTKPELEILRYRNIGKKSLPYLKQWLESKDLHLGMNFPKEITDQFRPQEIPESSKFGDLDISDFNGKF